MLADLCINLISTEKQVERNMHIFDSACLTPETECLLLNKIQEVFQTAMQHSISFRVIIQIETPHIFSLEKSLTEQQNFAYKEVNPKLSNREIEVLGLIMQGYTNNEISKKLFICYETVKSHRKSILQKTGAKNTASLINYYHQTFFDK